MQLQIGVLQRMISKHVRGYRFTGAPAATPQVAYADDCAFACHDMASIQLAFDTCWLVAKGAGCPSRSRARANRPTSPRTGKGEAEEKDVTGYRYKLRLSDGRIVLQIL